MLKHSPNNSTMPLLYFLEAVPHIWSPEEDSGVIKEADKRSTHVSLSISAMFVTKSMSTGLTGRTLYATLLPMYKTGKSMKGK